MQCERQAHWSVQHLLFITDRTRWNRRRRRRRRPPSLSHFASVWL